MKVLLICNPYHADALWCIPHFLSQLRCMLKKSGIECDILDYGIKKSLDDLDGYQHYFISYSDNVPFATSINDLMSICNELDKYGKVHVGGQGLEGVDSAYVLDNDFNSIWKVLGLPPVQKQLEFDFTGMKLSDYEYGPKRICSIFNRKLPKISVMPMTFIEGCNNACLFCQEYGVRARPVDTEQLYNVLTGLKRQGISNYMFLNPMINIDSAYLKKVCHVFKKVGIKWSDCARAPISHEELKMMKESGCVRLSFGIETGSEALRGRMGKNISNDQIIQTLEDCEKVGIWTHCSFIFNLPSSTEADHVKTVKFVKNHGHLIDQYSYNDYFLAKGSKFTTDYRKNMKIWKRRFERQKRQVEYPMLPCLREIDFHCVLLLDSLFSSKQEARMFLKKKT